MDCKFAGREGRGKEGRKELFQMLIQEEGCRRREMDETRRQACNCTREEKRRAAATAGKTYNPAAEAAAPARERESESEGEN